MPSPHKQIELRVSCLCRKHHAARLELILEAMAAGEAAIAHDADIAEIATSFCWVFITTAESVKKKRPHLFDAPIEDLKAQIHDLSTPLGSALSRYRCLLVTLVLKQIRHDLAYLPDVEASK